MELLGNEYLIVNGIILLAALTQSLSGFGFAIVAMSFLPGVVGLQTAVPLVSLISMVGNAIVWYSCRDNFNLQTVRRMIIASSIAIPLGVLLLDYLPEAIALKGLGVLILSYIIYDWLNFSLPSFKSTTWAYLFGGMSGILNGAYTVGGPPVIIYGKCRRWQPLEFRANLTAFFFFSSSIAAIAHGVRGNITLAVWRAIAYSLPLYGVGIWLGIVGSPKIDPVWFRKITLTLLSIAGLKLLI